MLYTRIQVVIEDRIKIQQVTNTQTIELELNLLSRLRKVKRTGNIVQE